MKKKPANIELVKDDEILREEGITDGPILVGGIEMRPVTAQSVSFMNRNNVLSEKDVIWRASAFAFIHSEPLPVVRSVINDPAAFSDAVDEWTEKHISHHSKSIAITNAIKDAFDRYNAAESRIADATGTVSGN